MKKQNTGLPAWTRVHCGRVLMTLLTILLTVTLVACGGGGDKEADEDNTGDGRNLTGPDANSAPSVQLGGLLWDNHWSMTGRTSTTTNPVWTLREADPVSGSTNDRIGNDTWRCKECHGWDYKGADGAYGPGSSHYTGFPGLLDRIPNLTREYVRNYLKNGIADPNNPQARLHNFGTGQPGLTDNQIEALVLFLFNGGLIDTSEYIFDGPFSKATKGDAARGLTLYNSGNANGASCGSVSCHGPNGDTILFDGGEESLGSLALDNPWEVLHKARFGQPGAPQMISVMQWGSNDDAGDIVAYTQTLPPPPLQ